MTAPVYTDLLNLSLPIIQAPMAGISTPQLAAAVSNAGGLGSLGLGACNATQAKAMIEQTQALTDRPFNVNVFCHSSEKRNIARDKAWLEHLSPFFTELGLETPQSLHEIYKSFLNDDSLFQTILNLRPAFISFHFGLPSEKQLDAIRHAGIITLATATNLAEARLIEAAGINIIIAQGIEAGGHRGMFDTHAVDERLSTAVLVRLLVCQQKLPVVAAGGIMDGYAVKAALDLGAIAAQLGTAFILCPESAADEYYRKNLRSEKSFSTRLTSSLSGRPARGLTNRFILENDSIGKPPAADYPFAYDAAKQLHKAALKDGNSEFGAYWAGQGAPLARELSAEHLMQVLAKELHQASLNTPYADLSNSH